MKTRDRVFARKLLRQFHGLLPGRGLSSSILRRAMLTAEDDTLPKAVKCRIVAGLAAVKDARDG